MTTDTYDPFDLPDAPVLGEGVVTIESARFGFDTNYNADAVVCTFEGTVRTDSGDTYPWDRIYSVGKGWEVADAGNRIVRELGDREIQKSSKYGMFVVAAGAAGARDILMERNGGTRPAWTNASIWKGLVFDVRASEVDYGGHVGKKTVLLPTKFLGTSGQANAAPSAVSSPSTSSPAISSTAQNGEVVQAVPKALAVKLKKLAKEVPDHGSFIDAAFLLDGVDGNTHIENLVVDSSAYYEELKAS